MRQMVSVLGIAAGILASCSEGKNGSSAGPADAARPDVGGGAEGGTTSAVDAGGLGANLNWHCPAAGASCAPGEVTTYNRCLLDSCEASLKLCPCEAWINCTTRCDCNDLACRAACIPTFDCLACGQSVSQCVAGSGCARPACYNPPDGGADVSRPIVIPPIVTVPAPATDAARDGVPSDGGGDAPSSDGGLQGTCADLRRCCESLASAPARSMCLSQLALLPTDPLCAAALLVYRGNGACQ
jgi:hypothetical protein